MDEQVKEVCSITVVFPVDSDEQAIGCKKKIQEVVKDNPDAQIRFMMMPVTGKPFVGG